MPNKALLVGINYVGTSNALNGCANDIESIRNLLLANAFLPEQITLISDAHRDARLAPSRDNILRSLDSLIRNARDGDTLFFHYSGHGSQQRDQLGGDEADRLDEVICPASGAWIKDDELKRLVTQLPQGVKFFALMDCCHSGTAIDLVNNTDQRSTRTTVVENHGYAAMLSGCRDNQTSADAFIGARYQGALTASFLAMEQSYKGLGKLFDIFFSNSLTKMRSLRNDIWNWLSDNDFDQRPNIAFEGKLPAILRSFQCGQYALRHAPRAARVEENAVTTVCANYAADSHSQLRELRQLR